MDKSGLSTRLSAHGQEHLLRFWEELGDEEKQKFSNELNGIDFELVNRKFQALDKLTGQEKKDDLITPLPENIVSSLRTECPERVALWEERGLAEIADGSVALVLLAGGQGTRLGVPYPKGMYDVGLPSGKTLYQLQAERLIALQRIATERQGKAGKVKWYIMTSEATQHQTETFFESHKYFGLEKKDVFMFSQHTLPCLSNDGKVILAEKGSVALSPDGNGGLYAALQSTGAISHMEQHGIKYLFVYCVDNILVRVADPVFMGYCVSAGADCANKVVEKTDPKEAVGATCMYKDKYFVCEYSEMTPETAELRTDDNRLVYPSANICNHFFTLDFVKMIASNHLSDLPDHVAKKKIPFIDDNGNRVAPKSPNGIKLEKFIFDVFQFSKNFVVFEVQRENEFSPLKNATGSQSPQTSHDDLLLLHQRLIEKAGGVFVDGKPGSLPNCEISPLLSYAGEGLEAEVSGREFTLGEEYELTKPTVVESNGTNGHANGQGPERKKSKM